MRSHMKWWAIGFGLAIVMIVVLADTRHLGMLGVIYDFPYGDKVGHFLLFGVLSLLVNLALLEFWREQHPWRQALKINLVLALLIGAEELSQRWIPTRTSSWADLAASYLGVSLFAGVALQTAKRRGEKAAEKEA